MADTHTYNHYDIKRYLQQQMSSEEMHAFEKAMMDDPFLADALEGFRAANNTTASAHLTWIEEEIRGKKEKAKVIAMPVKKGSWWKIAALVILIAGGGIISYLVLNPANETTQLVKQKTMAPVNAQTDTIKAAEQPLEKEDIFPEKGLLVQRPTASAPLLKQEKEAYEGSTALAMENVSSDTTIQAVAQGATFNKSATPAVAQNMPSDALARKSLNYESREFRGRVLGENGGPLPYASVRSNTNVNTMSDDKGNFTIKAPDSVIEVNVTSAGYAAAITKMKSEAVINDIVLQEDKNSLSEVVITGYGQDRKKTINDLSKTATANKDQKAVAKAEPVGGWESFHDYVTKKVNKERDTSFAYTQGDVLVEFTIDEKGKPRDVIAPAAASKSLAEKAVQIIEKGPRWKRTGKNEKAKVVIKF